MIVAGIHEIKPLMVSAVFIVKEPFLCVQFCNVDVSSHNGASDHSQAGLPIQLQAVGFMFHVKPIICNLCCTLEEHHHSLLMSNALSLFVTSNLSLRNLVGGLESYDLT